MAKQNNPQIEAVVPEVGTMLYVIDTFDEATRSMSGVGASLASSYDVARARLDGSNPSFGDRSWVRECFVYTPKNNPLLVRESPLVKFELASDATWAHRAGKDFYLDDAMAKSFSSQAEEDASKPLGERRVLRVKKAKDYAIPTNRFGNDEVTTFLFKDVAADYGRFLASNGAKKMPVWFADKKDVDRESMSLLRQLHFGSLYCNEGSRLDGKFGHLNLVGGFRGIRQST